MGGKTPTDETVFRALFIRQHDGEHKLTRMAQREREKEKEKEKKRGERGRDLEGITLGYRELLYVLI